MPHIGPLSRIVRGNDAGCITQTSAASEQGAKVGIECKCDSIVQKKSESEETLKTIVRAAVIASWSAAALTITLAIWT